MTSSQSSSLSLQQESSVIGKRLHDNRPKTYHLTTNEQRQKLLDAISRRGLSVLKVNAQSKQR